MLSIEKHLKVKQETVLGFAPNHIPLYYKLLVFWLHKCTNTVLPTVCILKKVQKLSVEQWTPQQNSMLTMKRKRCNVIS